MNKTARLLCSFAIFVIALIGAILHIYGYKLSVISLGLCAALSLLVTLSLFDDHLNED